MKRLFLVATVLLAVLFAVYDSARPVRAQQQPAVPGSALIVEPLAPSNASPVAKEKTSYRSLDCAVCHGAGKTLPYLGGEQFHAGAHNAYDRGFHARAIQSG